MANLLILVVQKFKAIIVEFRQNVQLANERYKNALDEKNFFLPYNNYAGRNLLKDSKVGCLPTGFFFSTSWATVYYIPPRPLNSIFPFRLASGFPAETL